MVPEEFPERRLLEMTFFPFLHHRLHERANLCIQNGTEGVVELTQWFERMETVFRISNCSVENQIKFSTCTLLAGALTWWNSQLDLFGSGCWVQPTYPGTSTVILPLLCVRMFPEESGQAVLLLDGLHLDDKLHFVEEPLEIVGREVKWLKRSRIPLVKVRWNSMRGLSLLGREDQFKKKYPHLFTKTAPSSSVHLVRNMPKPGSKTCIPNVQFNDMLSKFVTANTASTSGHDAFLANNGSTEDVQPPVVQVQTRNPNPEPNVAPVVTPVPKASIPFPSRRNDERRKEKEGIHQSTGIDSFDAESDLVESVLKRDISIDSAPKIDSLSNEFAENDLILADDDQLHQDCPDCEDSQFCHSSRVSHPQLHLGIRYPNLID
ncbi:hypothetical protein Tco_0013796 [Tanacetum coccineum]